MKVCPVCGTEYGEEAAFCSRDRSPLRPAQTAPMHGLVGQLVGDRYQVQSKLGAGGMGEVYLATHVMMGRRCALKVMSPELSKDPDAVSRFNREATNASRITHPNVCAVYDFGLTPDGLVYLAMEFVDGKTLTDLVEASGPMPVTAAAALVTQCAAGLEAAHALGIVHRDLKPDNIMVVSHKEGDTVKLVDFGIAKAAEHEPNQRVTKTGFVVGTPEYMSPEQVAGDQLDGRSDQYALALVFYRLVTGQLPFEGSTIQETLVKRLTEPPRPLTVARPQGRYPAGLQDVMDKALARKPADRYASVTAFVRAINALSNEDAVVTRPLAAASAKTADLPATRQTPARRRSRAGMVAAAVVVVGGAAYGVSRLTGSPPPVNPPAPPPAPQPASQQAAGPVDSPKVDTQKTAALKPVAPPPPAPPPTAPVTAAVMDTPKTVTSEPADTALPEPEHFDNPQQRAQAIFRATRLMNAQRQPPIKRARAAELLAMEQLRQGNKAEALMLFRRANNLFPMPRFQTMIRQLTDSVRP